MVCIYNGVLGFLFWDFSEKNEKNEPAVILVHRPIFAL